MSDAQSISSHLKESRRFEPSKEFAAKARIGSRADYDRLYRESIESPETVLEARDRVARVAQKPWTNAARAWKLPHAKWFDGATLNVTESCLDRHLDDRAPATRPRSSGRASSGDDAHAHLRRAAPRGGAPRRRARRARRREGRPRRHLHGHGPRGRGRDARVRAPRRDAHASSSAASPPTRCAIASTTARRKVLITQDGG